MNFINVISTYRVNSIKKKLLINFYNVFFIFKYTNIFIKEERYYYK